MIHKDYNSNMDIVISGILPHSSIAAELASQAAKAAPSLFQKLENSKGTVHLLDPGETGCTPFEYWQLAHRQFTPAGQQNYAAGLGPLYAPRQYNRDQPVWLLELAHIALGAANATLLTADDLVISESESLALFESAQVVFSESPFKLLQFDTQRWHIEIPPDMVLPSLSPNLIASRFVYDWWPQDTASRPLRKLINALQVEWHEHPVNLARRQANLPLINGAWVFGGATPAQLQPAPTANPPRILQQLEVAHRKQDWGQWLAILANLEQDVFSALPANKNGNLILTGYDRLVVVSADAMPAWLCKLLNRNHKWKDWWCQ
ncbi:hypothetical protein JHL22_07960 [Advenella sp. WQ 585]|uniref:Cofactor-independent phosphoglycerate mutase n=1 Tax=Advenella mandrilli TaxID=2800330 RepID=A0ABS1EC42_9BURK|nr:hypothetical protein [Advenella mandrilli]MBK1781149.1 hypothetical protein [Advenella mandrilli]